MYKALIFDLGGVMVSDWNAQGEWSSYMARRLRVDLSRVKQALAAHRADELAVEKGQLETRQFFERLWPALNTPVAFSDTLARELVVAPLQASVRVDQNMIGLLGGLRASGFKVGLLTNAFPEQIDFYMNFWPQLLEAFDAVALSYDAGMIKPEEAFYEHILVKLGTHAGEAIFIDDNPENAAAAQEYGLTGLVFTGYNELRGQLQKLGLPVP